MVEPERDDPWFQSTDKMLADGLIPSDRVSDGLGDRSTKEMC
ncbi:MAG: hypothetical protein AB4042_02855 [Leptolyngbyaceae cyanobacterium]